MDLFQSQSEAESALEILKNAKQKRNYVKV